MASIKVRHRGNFDRIERFFDRMRPRPYLSPLEKYGQMGVEALAAATPVRTGETASKWSYEIEDLGDKIALRFLNSNVVNNVNIALILQYGHGTGTGGYVQGRDYINPAIRPIFDQIASEAWEEVRRA